MKRLIFKSEFENVRDLEFLYKSGEGIFKKAFVGEYNNMKRKYNGMFCRYCERKIKNNYVEFYDDFYEMNVKAHLDCKIFYS